MNEFYLGDARQGLQRLAEQGRRVQLCYLDPPYLTGRDFGAYCDRFPSDEDYYAMMRAVLQGVYEVLDARGSLFLHIDWRTHARLRLLLEEIFGAEGFRNEIVWCYRSGGRAQTHFSRKHDTLLFFAKSRGAYFDAMQDPLPRAEVRSNHMKRGVDEDFQDRVRNLLTQKDEAVVFMVVSSMTEDKFAEAMRPFGGDILQTSLSIKDEEELKCELGKC